MTGYKRLLSAVPYGLIIAVALFFFIVAGSFDYVSAGSRLGPEIWPKMVIGLLIAAALGGMIQAAMNGATPSRQHDLLLNAGPALVPDAEIGKETAYPPNPRRMLMGVGALVAFVLLLPALGFTIACFLLLLSTIWLGGYRRVLPALLVALGGALGFFIVFQKLVYVSLPLGIGPFATASKLLLTLFGVR
jgi:putative tricarboxylic transport membrane protein